MSAGDFARFEARAEGFAEGFRSASTSDARKRRDEDVAKIEAERELVASSRAALAALCDESASRLRALARSTWTPASTPALELAETFAAMSASLACAPNPSVAS